MVKLILAGLIIGTLAWADDIKTLHRLAEKVAKSEAEYIKSIANFNKAARAWEAGCRAEGKTPNMNAFTNPTCLFVPVPTPPPGTNK